MLKTHQRQIVASRELKAVLEGMRRDLRATLGEVKNVIGHNLAALRFAEGRVREKGMATLEDVQAEEEGAKGRKKRAFVDVA
jgi:U3 small nucleolar RNA-associated protein 12